MKGAGKDFIKAIISLVLIVVAVLSVYFGYGFINKARYPVRFEDEVSAAAQAYDVDEALIYSVIRAESGFKEQVVSQANAIGLMQLVPETFLWLQSENDELPEATVEDLKTPSVNITYGVFYLKYLLDRYDNKTAAIAAYNAGPGNVNKWLENLEYSTDGTNLQLIPYAETRSYVAKVIAGEQMYNKLYFNEE